MPDLRLLRGGGGKETSDKTQVLPKTAIANPPDNGTDTVTTPHPDAIVPGSTMGNYLIISKIGEGGMGEVYKAHDTTLDRTVALKVLSPHLFRNQEFLQRFRVEAQAQARLNGPNIVTLHSMFEISGSLVLVMEYVEGSTLAQRIHNEGRLSLGTAVWVFEQALIGVERAHRMGIVHRDLKPSNIFITNTHEIKLMDFGVAKILDNQELTQTGSMIGTLMYISPEQISGKEADFRSDIYTLGITLFEAATGRLPFEKKTDYEYMDAHLHTPPPRPSSYQADIPKEMEEIILKAIEKDPAARYQNALEFRSALIKIGMQHVKAYRRLKTIRKDKDKAVLSHYTQPRITRPDLGAGKTTAREPVQLQLRMRYILGGMAALAVIVVSAIGAGYYIAKQPEAAPVLVEATAPEIAAQSPVIEIGPGDANRIQPESAMGPPKVVEPMADETREPVVKKRKPRPKDTAAVNPVPEPKPAEDEKNYDSLRKAWGG